MTASSTRRWVDAARARHRGRRRRPAAGLPRRRRRRRASSPAAASTSACWSATRRTPSSAARFTALGRRWPRRCSLTQERTRLDALRAVAVNSGNANAATGSRGLDEAARDAGRRPRWRAACPRTRSRSPPPASSACSSTAEAIVRGPRGAHASCAPTATRDFQTAIMTTDAFDKRAALDVELPARHRAAHRAGQGRGDDPAALRDDALLRADRRRRSRPRPPTCCSASASSARSTASPSTASCRPTTR